MCINETEHTNFCYRFDAPRVLGILHVKCSLVKLKKSSQDLFYHSDFSYVFFLTYTPIFCGVMFFFLDAELRTRVIKKNLNPEWNENLTLSATDPILPVKIVWDSYTTTTCSFSVRLKQNRTYMEVCHFII